jgi:hypothetical protein
MENENIGKRGMGINYNGSQGQTECYRKKKKNVKTAFVVGIPLLNPNFPGTNVLTCKCRFIILNKADQQHTQQNAMKAFPIIEFH